MRVLCVRFSSIGDIILTTPIIRCLKLQTDAEIHYLTKKSYLSLLLSNPHIDQIHLLDKSLPEMIKELQSINFDHVIDLQNNLKSLRVSRGVGGRRHTFDKTNVAKWLMVNFKVDRLSHLHIVDRYFGAVSNLEIQNDDKGLDLYYRSDPELKLSNPSFIAFAIGGAHSTKRLPKEKILEICTGLQYQTILVGGPEDVDVANFITESCPLVKNFVGKINLDGSLQIIDQAVMVIAHDTGMMHAAAALKKPVLSIWGNTIPRFGMGPYYPTGSDIPSTIFEVNNLKCRPCSKIGFKQCPKGHFNCMNLHDIPGIVAKANEMFLSLR